MDRGLDHWNGVLDYWTGVLDRAHAQKTNGRAINGWGPFRWQCLTRSDMSVTIYIVGSV